MKPTTAAYRGLPDKVPTNCMTVGMLAEQNGWKVASTYLLKPRSHVVLRLSYPDCPRVWAGWIDGRFWRSYAQTAQRLSLADLKKVLRDPTVLTSFDPEDPFGTQVTEDVVVA